MKCAICKHGEITPGAATITFKRGTTTLVYKQVPALVCGNCGEEYIDEEVTGKLLRSAEEAVESGVEVDVRLYHAA